MQKRPVLGVSATGEGFRTPDPPGSISGPFSNEIRHSMSKRKSRKPPRRLPASESMWIGRFRSCGWYVMFDGSGTGRVWRVFDDKTGKPGGWWCPHSRLGFVHGSSVSDVADAESFLNALTRLGAG